MFCFIVQCQCKLNFDSKNYLFLSESTYTVLVENVSDNTADIFYRKKKKIHNIEIIVNSHHTIIIIKILYSRCPIISYYYIA